MSEIRINKVLRELNISLERAVDYFYSVEKKIESNPNAKITIEEYEELKSFFREKPQSILNLEKIYNLKLTKEPLNSKIKNQNSFSEDINGNVIKISITSSNIVYIKGFDDFHELKELSLRQNKIHKIENLENLINLKKFDLFQNNIKVIENLENLIDLEEINFGSNQIKKIERFEQCKKLNRLYLASNQIEVIENLDKNRELKYLDFSFNKLKKIQNLEGFDKLRRLSLVGNEISVIENLDQLINLEDLSLSHNNINKIENIDNLKKLKYLSLDGNYISKIENLNSLFEIYYLALSDNLISKIENLSKFNNLQLLFLENNKIEKIENIFEILEIKDLKDLKIHNNPFLEKTDLKLDSSDIKSNHLNEVLSYLERNLELNKVNVVLPAKVLFFGNHASGKSTFSNYLLQETEIREIKKDIGSTHILNIHSYKKEIENHNLPKAILFDFGGQDYYHGVYKAFMTNDSINLVFWKKENDKNQLRTDNENNNWKTQDFDRNYWLHQLNYFYDSSSKDSETQPVYLIQTHADKEQRQTINESCEELHIENEFFISLNDEKLKEKSFKASLDYFEYSLIERIESKRIVKEEPQWYIDFINFILNFDKSSATRLTSLQNEYKRKENENFLSDDLYQLSKKGIVLYYPKNKILNNYVWLNPNKTVEFIHKEILSKDFISDHNGKVPKETFENNVTDRKLIELLKENKVIFLDTTNPEKQFYIIPGYLPLAENNEEEYFILSDFDKPNFVLKFEYFIPFGFINRLVCFYGENPEKKIYWRDQLLFTTKNQEAKVLIKLDFEDLEIKVNIKAKNEDFSIDEIEKKIFNDIIILYYEKEKDEKEKDQKEHGIKRLGRGLAALLGNGKPEWSYLPIIKDLYISVDNKNFVHHSTLEDMEKTKTEIISYSKNEQNKLIKTQGKIQSSIFYKNFTTNKNIKSMKKIFISYSNKDYGYLEKLKTHLSPFNQLKIIESWDCTKLQTGNWHEQIQNNLKEADIVIFMLSANFLESNYILSQELLPSFKEIRDNKNKKLMFVVVKSFAYNALSKYSDLTGNIDLSNSENMLLELTKHQFIPYEIKEINGNKERKLTPIKKWEDEDDAYVEIINQLVNNL